MTVVIAALYHFAPVADCTLWREALLRAGEELGIRGMLILAKEGINGTIAGTRQGIDEILRLIRSESNFAELVHKESFAEEMPFVRLRISIKNEIVTMREPQANPSEIVGTYVSPQEWNKIISDPEVVLIDTRNDYEYDIGTFRGAVNPNTKTFTEFPGYIKNLNLDKSKKVAMFCTGGIRCEKASSFMRLIGFDNVYHLKGGILKYLEEIPPEESMWDGHCYVFDKRVSVGHKLEVGPYKCCFSCRHPLRPEDVASPDFMEGVQCGYCVSSKDEKAKQRCEERQRQVHLSDQRHEQHIGKRFIKQYRQRGEGGVAEEEGVARQVVESQLPIEAVIEEMPIFVNA
jgi:UPF0176 protein